MSALLLSSLQSPVNKKQKRPKGKWKGRNRKGQGAPEWGVNHRRLWPVSHRCPAILEYSITQIPRIVSCVHQINDLGVAGPASAFSVVHEALSSRLCPLPLIRSAVDR